MSVFGARKVSQRAERPSKARGNRRRRCTRLTIRPKRACPRRAGVGGTILLATIAFSSASPAGEELAALTLTDNWPPTETTNPGGPDSISLGILFDAPTEWSETYGTAVSPTGIVLPGMFPNIAGIPGSSQVTYFSSELNGIQIGVTEETVWTRRRASMSSKSDGVRLQRKGKKSFGLGFTESIGGMRISLSGDYGKSAKPVKNSYDVGGDRRLGRLGVDIRYDDLRIGTTFGTEIEPQDVGEAFAWDLAASYSLGRWSLGLAYNYTWVADTNGEEREDILGTFRGGISFAITPEIQANLHAVYWDFQEENGDRTDDLAGMFGLSWRF